MRYRFASRDFLDCGGPTGICQRSVPYTINIIFRLKFYFLLHLFDILASRVGGN